MTCVAQHQNISPGYNLDEKKTNPNITLKSKRFNSNNHIV